MHEDPRSLTSYPTWERYTILAHAIGALTVRDRRRIFQVARSTDGPWQNVLFPHLGFTLSEFAVWHTLGDHRRRVRSRTHDVALTPPTGATEPPDTEEAN